MDYMTLPDVVDIIDKIQECYPNEYHWNNFAIEAAIVACTHRELGERIIRDCETSHQPTSEQLRLRLVGQCRYLLNVVRTFHIYCEKNPSYYEKAWNAHKTKNCQIDFKVICRKMARIFKLNTELVKIVRQLENNCIPITRKLINPNRLEMPIPVFLYMYSYFIRQRKDKYAASLTSLVSFSCDSFATAASSINDYEFFDAMEGSLSCSQVTIFNCNPSREHIILPKRCPSTASLMRLVIEQPYEKTETKVRQVVSEVPMRPWADYLTSDMDLQKGQTCRPWTAVQGANKKKLHFNQYIEEGLHMSKEEAKEALLKKKKQGNQLHTAYSEPPPNLFPKPSCESDDETVSSDLGEGIHYVNDYFTSESIDSLSLQSVCEDVTYYSSSDDISAVTGSLFNVSSDPLTTTSSDDMHSDVLVQGTTSEKFFPYTMQKKDSDYMKYHHSEVVLPRSSALEKDRSEMCFRTNDNEDECAYTDSMPTIKHKYIVSTHSAYPEAGDKHKTVEGYVCSGNYQANHVSESTKSAKSSNDVPVRRPSYIPVPIRKNKQSYVELQSKSNDICSTDTEQNKRATKLKENIATTATKSVKNVIAGYRMTSTKNFLPESSNHGKIITPEQEKRNTVKFHPLTKEMTWTDKGSNIVQQSTTDTCIKNSIEKNMKGAKSTGRVPIDTYSSQHMNYTKAASHIKLASSGMKAQEDKAASTTFITSNRVVRKESSEIRNESIKVNSLLKTDKKMYSTTSNEQSELDRRSSNMLKTHISAGYQGTALFNNGLITPSYDAIEETSKISITSTYMPPKKRTILPCDVGNYPEKQSETFTPKNFTQKTVNVKETLKYISPETLAKVTAELKSNKMVYSNQPSRTSEKSYGRSEDQQKGLKISKLHADGHKLKKNPGFIDIAMRRYNPVVYSNEHREHSISEYGGLYNNLHPHLDKLQRQPGFIHIAMREYTPVCSCREYCHQINSDGGLYPSNKVSVCEACRQIAATERKKKASAEYRMRPLKALLGQVNMSTNRDSTEYRRQIQEFWKQGASDGIYDSKK